MFFTFLKDTAYPLNPFVLGSLVFHDEVSTVRGEVQSLTNSGINKIIALGHAGFEVDKKIAEIDGVDIVIGGHTNTFLYTGKKKILFSCYMILKKG